MRSNRYFNNKILRYADKSALLYGIVGITNTIIGYGIMFGLTFVGVIPEIANAIGYILGFINSYILNRKFTFKSKNNHKRDFTRFLFVTIIVYFANLLTLVICFRIFNMNEYISLIIANIVYIILGYILHKCWTFK